MAEPKKASLGDLINYKPDNYFSDDELALMRAVFGDKPQVIALLRKLFLPTVHDAELPVEQFANDIYMSGRNWDQIPAEEAKILIVARQEMVKYVMGAIIRLKVLANSEPLSPQELARNAEKDSTQ